MTGLTQEQKEAIYNHGASLGIEDETLKLIVPQVTTEYEEVLSTTRAYDFIAGVFGWLESEQGHEFWYKVYCSYRGFKSQREQVQDYQEEVPLTQSDIQSLLHIVRDRLYDVTYNKQHSSAVAGEYWAKSDKENPETSADFHCFSVHNKYTKEMKAKEKKLVHLIKRLKAMR